MFLTGAADVIITVKLTALQLIGHIFASVCQLQEQYLAQCNGFLTVCKHAVARASSEAAHSTVHNPLQEPVYCAVWIWMGASTAEL